MPQISRIFDRPRVVGLAEGVAAQAHVVVSAIVCSFSSSRRTLFFSTTALRYCPSRKPRLIAFNKLPLGKIQLRTIELIVPKRH